MKFIVIGLMKPAAVLLYGWTLGAFRTWGISLISGLLSLVFSPGGKFHTFKLEKPGFHATFM